MKEPLTAEERKAFEEISYAIGDRKAHPLEDIKGVAVQKHLIPFYMKIFVEKGYYDFDGRFYILSKTGKSKFMEKQDSDSRKVIPRISF